METETGQEIKTGRKTERGRKMETGDGTGHGTGRETETGQEIKMGQRRDRRQDGTGRRRRPGAQGGLQVVGAGERELAVAGRGRHLRLN